MQLRYTKEAFALKNVFILLLLRIFPVVRERRSFISLFFYCCRVNKSLRFNKNLSNCELSIDIVTLELSDERQQGRTRLKTRNRDGEPFFKQRSAPIQAYQKAITSL